jgi:hypothetical protein
MGRNALDQTPHRHLGKCTAKKNRGRDTADELERNVAPDAGVDDLGQRDRQCVEDQTGEQRKQHEQRNHGDGQPAIEHDVMHGRRRRAPAAFVRH